MKHILIVDDDLDIHRLLKIYFKGLNFKLHFAFDNEAALAHLEHEDIAFIFLDIIIGNNETSHEVLKLSGGRPIFLMSSHLTEAYCQRVVGKNINILDCLPKPFTKDEILRLLEEYKDFEYGSTKFDPNEEVHIIIGDGKDIGEESFGVSGLKEGKDASQVISGSKDDLGEGSSRISGTKDKNNESQVVKGTKDDIVDKSKHVFSKGVDEEKSQIIRGKKEDLAEEVKKIAGDKEDPEENQLVSGTKEDLTEELTHVSGDSEEEETVFNIESQLEETVGDELVMISGMGLSSDEKELLRIKHIGDLETLKAEGPLSRSDAGYTRLMLAVFLEDLEEVRQALEDGEIIDTLCRGGYSALHFAVVKDLPEIVEFLISKGAKLTVKDNDGREPLYFAIFKERLNIVKMLIDAGAPLNRRVKGRTYLMIAVAKRNEVIFKYLLSKGISLHTRDSNGFNINYYLKKYKLEHYLPSKSVS